MIRRGVAPVATAVAAFVVIVQPSFAQQSGTSEHRWSGVSQPPAAREAGRTRLRLVDESVFPVGGRETGRPTGIPGAISETGVSQEAYGEAAEKWPYSTARVAVTDVGKSNTEKQTPVTSYPFRATGKLWMRFGGSWFICTASLIKKGVLITAAHCVHNYGMGTAGFADEVWWAPANLASSQPSTKTEDQPFGWYKGLQWRVPNVYRDGNDTCEAAAIGIVCNNDIATVTLRPRGNPAVYAGEVVGWYSYGWNGFSSIASPAFGNITVSLITQLGYPAGLDSGGQMIRTDSLGKYVEGTGPNAKTLKNTQLGSAQTGGSSGGPWLVNFGTKPTLTGGASLGFDRTSNVIVGVTSWGYTTVGANVQGASWFGQNNEFPNTGYGGHGAGNIGKIVRDTCVAHPEYC